MDSAHRRSNARGPSGRRVWHSRSGIRGTVVAAAAVLLAGCVNHDFVPGPGMLASNLGPQAAGCRIFARGSQGGYAFGAAGSPRFVAAAAGIAAIGAGIAGAVQQNHNYNDCMLSRGWRVADGTPGQLAINAVQVEDVPPIATASRSSERRRMRVRVDALSASEAYDLNLPSNGGLVVLEVLPGGVGNSAGLAAGDVILQFNGTTVARIDDMQRWLNGTAANGIVTATVWRNGEERPFPLEF
jgi:membrane-associated protease RseP (regulator of RpoE activity)